MTRKQRRVASKFADEDLVSKSLSVDDNLPHLGSKVRFSLKRCETSKNHCITNCKTVLPDLYRRLGHFENMTWRDMQRLSREAGISIEGKKSANHKTLAEKYNGFSTFGHFRVPSTNKGKFRVFGAQSEDLFYILMFDVDGKFNH